MLNQPGSVAALPFCVIETHANQRLVNLCDFCPMTDADRAEMNTLMRAYEVGGEEALFKAMNELKEKDQNCFSRVASALQA
jgi:hypothetical protein